jgi:PDZ domain-containing protein
LRDLAARRRSYLRAGLWAFIAVIVVIVGWLPIPYFIYGPGAAVSLNEAIAVPGKTPPPGVLYLTDIRLYPGRPIVYAIAYVLPGFEIVKRSDLVPPNVTDRQLNVQLADAMTESQLNAQVVAERAAGLPVRATIVYVVQGTKAKTPAARCFRAGDEIVAMDGRAFGTNDDLLRTTALHKAGTRFNLTLMRAGKDVAVTCQTFSLSGKARFGVYIQPQTRAIKLPVNVVFHLPDVNGSSAGLMFSLQIYRTLTGADITGGKNIAGTGVLAADGGVSAISGTREKIQAAIRAGATVFLVPVDNYKDVAGTRGISIIPVRSFAEALHALALQRVPKSKTV